MPVPTLVTDLSTTLASNSPAGSDNVFPDLDNYLRALSGFVASIRDNSGNGWVSPYLPLAGGTVTGATIFSSTVALNGALSGTGLTTYLASPPAIGGTTPAAGSFTTLSASGNVTLSGGTANGVLYLNGSKVATSGSALTYNGSALSLYSTVAGLSIQTALNTNQATITLADADGRTAVFRSPNSGSPNAAQIGTTTNHDVAFLYGGSEQMRLTSTGLGIGTSSPTLKLDVNGSAKFAGNYVSFNDNGYIRTDAANILRFQPGSGGYEFRNTSNSDNLAVLDSSGNLGIGTSSPGAKLDVQAGATSDAVSIRSTLNTNGAAVAGIAQFGGNSLGTSVAYSGIYGNIDSNTAGSHGGGMRFFTATSGSFTEKMRLDSSGNLGVGTTSPAVKLHVKSGNGSQIIADNAGEVYSGFDIYNNGTRKAFVQNHNTNNLLYVGSDTGGIAFYTNNTERARITSGGDLLVGVTVAQALVTAGPVASKVGLFGSASSAGSPGVQGAHTDNSATGYVAYFANSGSGTGLYISNTAAWQSTSDERLKTDIKDLDSTARLMKLRPRDYLWKSQATSDNPTKRSFGFIAQEVQQIFPELVGVSPDEMLSVEYTGLIAPLVKAIQELKAELDATKARLVALESN